MTVSEAIERGAVLYPADVDAEGAYIFLSEIESRISTELFGGENVILTAADSLLELRADGAFAQIYPLYIARGRELAIGDSERYAFLNAVFESLYSDYANSINRGRAQGKNICIRTV